LGDPALMAIDPDAPVFVAIVLVYLAWLLQSVLRIVVALGRIAINWLAGWEGD
jgi:hypothetical protein